MIDVVQLKAVQRRVALLGRFNADPYDPNQWWVAGDGTRSLLYRFKVGVNDNPAENLYGLRPGFDDATRAARRQTLYAVLRPMFREKTVPVELSGGQLRMSFTRAEIPAQEDDPGGKFTPGVVIDERSPLRDLTGASGFDILDALGTDLDTFLSFEAAGGFDQVRLLFAAYCNQFPEGVAEEIRDGNLSAEVARVLANALLAPGPECVLANDDLTKVLLPASAGVPLNELIEDFRTLCLAENITSLQPGPTMRSKYRPTPVPLGGKPADRIKDALDRLKKDDKNHDAKVARITEYSPALSDGAALLAQFRAARNGLNRIAQVLQSNLLLGAVAAWVLTDDKHFSTEQLAFDVETENVFEQGVLLAGKSGRQVPIRDAVLKEVDRAREEWTAANPADEALAAATDALYAMGRTRLLAQPEFRPSEIRDSGIADAGWLLTQAITAGNPAYRAAAEEQSEESGKELQNLLADYAEFRRALPAGEMLPLGADLRWTFSDKSELREVVLRKDQVSYRGRVTDAGIQELYQKARAADVEEAARGTNPSLRDALAEAEDDRQRERLLTQFKADRPFTRAVHDTLLQAEPMLPAPPPDSDTSPEANELRVRVNSCRERLKQTMATLMSGHRRLAGEIHGENERLIGGFNRVLPLILEAAERTGQSARPDASADLKALTAAQGVPVAVSTTALARRPNAQRPLDRLGVKVPAGTDVKSYHDGRQKILARFKELVDAKNMTDEFVCRARRMALAQIVLHVNNRLPMSDRPDLGNLAGLIHELARHWRPGPKDATHKKQVREAFFAANPGGLTRFLPLVTLTDTREVARQYQEQSARSRDALRDLITDLRGLEYLVENLPDGSELLVLNMTADDYVRVPQLGVNFKNRAWPKGFRSAESLQQGAPGGSLVPLAVIVSRSAQRWGEKWEERLPAFLDELNKKTGTLSGRAVVPPVILAADTLADAESTLKELDAVGAKLDERRAGLGFPVHVCGLTPAVLEGPRARPLPGQAPYLLAANLLGHRDARPVEANDEHPIPTSPLSLGFTTKSAMPVADVVAAWVRGDGSTPALGASLYAYLRSLQHRAEIMGPAGTATYRVHVPDPATDPDGFRDATAQFYRLSHLYSATDRAQLQQQQIDQMGYYAGQLDSRFADFGFPMLNGVPFTYAALALSGDAPAPPPGAQITVRRDAGPGVPVVWLMRQLGITCKPAPTAVAPPAV